MHNFHKFSRFPRRSLLIVTILACAIAIGATHAHAQLSIDREYQIKAAFLYNFAKFVEWPNGAVPESGAPLPLCVLGDDPFGEALNSVEGKIVRGRRLVVRRLAAPPRPGACDILFISSSEKERVPQILDALKGSSVLTVSDLDNFARLGGIIMLVVESNRVGFRINVDAAEAARLKISSQLLKLATVIRTPPRR